MQDLPPKALKTQLVHLDRNLKDIERSQFAGIQRAPGSLPVLEAFQGFLEKERQIARRRLMLVTLTSIFLLLLISGAGAAFIYMQIKNMKVDYSVVTTQATELESQLNAKADATQSQLSTLEAYLNNNAANHTQLLASHSNATTRATQDHEQLAEMQTSLVALARENKALKTQINNIVQDWQSIKHNSDNTTGKPPARTPRHQEGRAQLSEQATASFSEHDTQNLAPRNQYPSTSIELTIVPPNQNHGIRWRLPRLQ